MKYLLLLLLALPNLSHALTVTISNAGGNWSANGTWVGGVPPTALDDVVATATSGQVTVNTTTCVCKTLVLTGYTNTLTFTSGQILTVSGNVTLAGTIAGTGTLSVNSTATLTSNGKTLSGALRFNSAGASTITFADNWIVTGTVSCLSTIAGVTLNGSQLTCNGSLTITNFSFSGTTNIILAGTGTWSGTNSSNFVANNITINTAGTVTLGTNVAYQTGTLTYTSGTVTTTNSTVTIRASCTLDTNGITFNNITANVATSTITLLSALTCTGLLSVDQISINTTFSGAFPITTGSMIINAGTLTLSNDITVTGDLTLGQATSTLIGNFNLKVGGGVLNRSVICTSTVGNSTLVLNGTGTITCTTSNSLMNLPIVINTSGIITFGPIFYAGGSTNLTFISGSVDTETNKTALYPAGNFTWPAYGGAVSFPSVASFLGNRTITLTSDLTLSGSIICGAYFVAGNTASTLNFSGNFDVTCDAIKLFSGGSITMPAGRTLTVNTKMSIWGEPGGVFAPNFTPYLDLVTPLLKSGTASSTFNLKYLGTPANMSIFGALFTDVNASQSTYPILNYDGGTLSNTTNIYNRSLPTLCRGEE